MDDCRIIRVNEQHNDQLLSILGASPMQAGMLRLCFDKSPDIFAIGRMKYKDNLHLGFTWKGALKGFGSVGYYDALVGGQPETVYSIYHFYISPDARGNKIPLVAGREMAKAVAGTNAARGLSLTLRGNRAMESYVHRVLGDWGPAIGVIGQWVVKSMIFCRPMKNDTPYRVMHATDREVTDLVKLLQQEHRQRDFGIPQTEETFLAGLNKRNLRLSDYYVAKDRSGAVKGVCLAWDCSAFRRTRVLQYAPSFLPYLAGYKLLSSVYPMAPFPKKGEAFRELTITDYAVDQRDPAILHALLTEIYRHHRNRQFHFMNWGSCAGDPLLNAARGFWSKDIVSNMVLTSRDRQDLQRNWRLPWIDIAYL